MARKKQDIILENVVIEAVAAEGKALAKVDGAVLFVQFAVPGDVVDVKVTKKKKNYMEGFILRMVKPSEHRLEPFCKHFGVCGGCKWQPLPYQIYDHSDTQRNRSESTQKREPTHILSSCSTFLESIITHSCRKCNPFL